MEKASGAYRTISEVAEELDVPQHVLRFWETRFPQIKPMKRSGGRRYYRPAHVALLRGIRRLLYGEGYTIKGVQRILESQGIGVVQAAGGGIPDEPVEATEEDAALILGEFEAELPQTSFDPSDTRVEPSLDDDQLVAPIFKAVDPHRALRTAEDQPHELVDVSRSAVPDIVQPSAMPLSAKQLQLLETAYAELVECNRILDLAHACDLPAIGSHDSAAGAA